MEVIIAILAFVVGIILIISKVLKNTNEPRNDRSAHRYKAAPPVTYVDNKAVPPQIKSLPPMPANLMLTGKAYVIDGDTIVIKKTKIRLSGIDAPELNMPWGQKSKWAMVGICKGQVVTAKLDGERSFDRLVGTCYLPDGRDIGAEIIKTGLALDLPHFSGGKYSHLEPEGARSRLGSGKFGHRSIYRKH